jgi:hypothetical protein
VQLRCGELGGRGNALTLCKDEVVLLNEALEVVCLELLDVGSSNNSRKEGGADSRVLHGAVVGCDRTVKW